MIFNRLSLLFDIPAALAPINFNCLFFLLSPPFPRRVDFLVCFLLSTCLGLTSSVDATDPLETSDFLASFPPRSNLSLAMKNLAVSSDCCQYLKNPVSHERNNTFLWCKSHQTCNSLSQCVEIYIYHQRNILYYCCYSNGMVYLFYQHFFYHKYLFWNIYH